MEYGQEHTLRSVGVGSGSNEKSNGLADMLLGVRFGRLVCSGDVGVMYPARDIAVWRLVAQLSRMKLWASNLLCFCSIRCDLRIVCFPA